jgi:putative tryptophan/tyrosine transport system substrate-binding protein
MREAAGALGVQIEELRASTDAEMDAGFETVARQRIGALAVAAGPFFDTRRDKFVALAARCAVPTMYHFREFTTAGGLMSYGVDSRVTYRQIGIYTGAIIRGEKPAELPVLQPTRFELVINLKTAKALGLIIAPRLLALLLSPKRRRPRSRLASCQAGHFTLTQLVDRPER